MLMEAAKDRYIGCPNKNAFSSPTTQHSWGTFVRYCVPQLIAVCVLYTDIKISTLFEQMGRLLQT